MYNSIETIATSIWFEHNYGAFNTIDIIIHFHITVFHEYLAGIIFSEFVILEISRVFNLAMPLYEAYDYVTMT